MDAFLGGIEDGAGLAMQRACISYSIPTPQVSFTPSFLAGPALWGVRANQRHMRSSVLPDRVSGHAGISAAAK